MCVQEGAGVLLNNLCVCLHVYVTYMHVNAQLVLHTYKPPLYLEPLWWFICEFDTCLQETNGQGALQGWWWFCTEKQPEGWCVGGGGGGRGTTTKKIHMYLYTDHTNIMHTSYTYLHTHHTP